MPTLKISPVTLPGHYVTLLPQAEEHAPALVAAGQDPEIWRYMRQGPLDTEERMLAFTRKLADKQAAGTDLPFVVVWRATGALIGMTRYIDIQLEHRGLEIGGTWFNPAFWRTAANSESKYLLLRHAFETLGCIRVQFKADLLNERSNRAIERLGAVREGVLRDHLIMQDGRIRSSVYYSILSSEWPQAKARLEERLAPASAPEGRMR